MFICFEIKKLILFNIYKLRIKNIFMSLKIVLTNLLKTSILKYKHKRKVA